ncbi:hypothetical protein M5M_15035 [Simiduia agarivorans SA1 = DSM 21679]|uniref:diguanylate cyclase n=1 Tax=Simiduia agarivorans (strain DSM 21679 / JCM 13881 / BCRC 17597 / SA1) TaxID=1117647 RepID=K4KMA7_SIMAS|nr:hypothetical protein M5M_15035 [Simiduia agarivorans SA1 = DSM 21679]
MTKKYRTRQWILSVAFGSGLACSIALCVGAPAVLAESESLSAEELFRGLENAEFIGGLELYKSKLAQLRQQIDMSDARMRERYDRLACWYQPDSNKDEAFAAIAQAEQWIKAAKAEEHLAAQADFTLCRGWFRELIGEWTDAQSDYNAALALAEQAEDRRLVADALGARAELMAFRGDLGQALEDFQAAHHIFHSLGIRYWSTYYVSMIANTYRRMGDYVQARELLEDVIQQFRQRGDQDSVRQSETLLALTLDELGEFAAAEAIYADQLKNYREKNEQYGVLSTLISLADNRQRAGQPDAAWTYLKQAEPLLHLSYDGGTLALWHLLTAAVLVDKDQAESALVHIVEAEAPLAQHESLRYLSWVQKLKAEALAQTGQWEAAFNAMQIYQQTQETLAKKQRELTSTRLRVEFDSARKEAENEMLRAESRAQNARLESLEERRRWQGLVFVLSAVLLTVLGVWGHKQWRHSRRMHQLALTDELTGMPNRRAVYAYGGDILLRCIGDESAFSILVFDVDYFKRINDTWGHDVGDSVLQTLARISGGVVRKGDLVGRTGGEEFLAILPGADVGQATEVAERLRKRVEQADMRAVADDLTVTISIGVAQYQPADQDFPRLIQRADNALYAAKNAGRNRVELA